ncbi:MAG: lysophospholipase [Deltaproteobacteria bacterium]|nr:lysophospholipase [Deltaproteobacteria bacterium]
MHKLHETTGYFSGDKDLKIFYRNLSAEKEKARLIIAHGLGEHSGRYDRVINRLVPEGLSIWALDFCGHGRSGGKRGHIESFDQYIADIDKLIEIASEDAPQDTKIFLLGHSLGGLIALNYGLRLPDKLNGLIVSSPVLAFKVKVPAFKIISGKVMSAVWPGLSMANELDLTKISHDRSVVDAYIHDPLVHNRVTARWFTEFISAMAWVQESVKKMQVPILMQIAGSDFLVDAGASETFFNHLLLKDKTIHIYRELFHEIFNETADESAVVLDDLLAWLKMHI